jgi:hypothetical protein
MAHGHSKKTVFLSRKSLKMVTNGKALKHRSLIGVTLISSTGGDISNRGKGDVQSPPSTAGAYVVI